MFFIRTSLQFSVNAGDGASIHETGDFIQTVLQPSAAQLAVSAGNDCTQFQVEAAVNSESTYTYLEEW